MAKVATVSFAASTLQSSDSSSGGTAREYTTACFQLSTYPTMTIGIPSQQFISVNNGTGSARLEGIGTTCDQYSTETDVSYDTHNDTVAPASSHVLQPLQDLFGHVYETHRPLTVQSVTLKLSDPLQHCVRDLCMSPTK
jgi:hypothetical protein